MNEPDVRGGEHSMIAIDEGPRCLGIPLAGRRDLTVSERDELRRYLYRRTALAAVWLFAFPIAFVCCSILDAILRPFGTSPIAPIFLFLTVAGLPGLFVFVLNFVTKGNPIGRAAATFTDYRNGYAEICEGKFNKEKFKYEILTYGPSRKGKEIIFALRDTFVNEPEETQTLERFPHSGRLWTINGDLTAQWLEVIWSGVQKVVIHEPTTTTRAEFERREEIIITCWISFFFAVFFTIIVNNCWDLGVQHLVLAFCSIFFVASAICRFLFYRASKSSASEE